MYIYIYATLYNIRYPIFRKIPDFAASTPHHRQLCTSTRAALPMSFAAPGLPASPGATLK